MAYMKDATGRRLDSFKSTDGLGLDAGNGLVPVATRTNSMSNGNRTQELTFGRIGRISHVAPNGAQGLTLKYANIYDSGYAGAPNTNPIAIRVAIEYPLGTVYPVTFRGKRTAVIDGGGMVTSDPVGVTIPVGATFYERCYAAVPFPAKTLAASASGTGALAGTYYYRVASVTEAGESGVQAAAVSVAPSSQAVGLTWTDGNEILQTLAFNIYRGTASGSEKWIATVPAFNPAGAYAFTDTGLAASTTATPAAPWIPWGVSLSTAIANENIYFNGVGALYPSSPTWSSTSSPVLTAFGIYGSPLSEDPAPAVGLVGDSIMSGTGDTAGTQGALNRNGFAVRALGDTFVWLNRAKGGETLANFQTNMRDRRINSITGCRYVISNYGTNSLATASVAAMKASVLEITAALNAAGSKVFWCTIVPKTTSTDTWATAGNQTPINTPDSVDGTYPNAEARRVALNTWLRDTTSSGYVAQAGGPAKAAVYEIADRVEVNAANAPTRNGGRWLTNGAASYPTTDGTHPTAAMHALMSAGVDTTQLV